MKIHLDNLNSEVVIDEIGKLPAAIKNLDQRYTQIFIITDDKIAPLWLKKIEHELEKTGLKIHSHIIPAGESSKSISIANACWEEMHKLVLDRQSLVVGLGGGVVTDLAGFVAGTYMRGIDVIQIPTTLMGMADAAIGGKTAVNLSSGKNIVGVLHQPKIVFVDPTFLTTLPKKEFSSGLSEVIKYGVIWDKDLFEYLERSMSDVLNLKSKALTKILTTSASIKAEIVKQDPTEQNLRAILNFGHTFAHALETLTQYKSYLHGEAVAIGMSCAAILSQSMQLCSRDVVTRINTLCHKAGLNTQLPDSISCEKMVDLMGYDKKSIQGRLNLILVQEIGKVSKLHDIDPKIVLSGLRTKIETDKDAERS